MPQYDIAVPGKGTFRVNSPTPLTDEQAWQAVQNQVNAPEPKAAGFSLKDLALSFGQGVGGGAQAITDIVGAGNVVSKGLTGLQQAAGEAMTPERQAEILRRQEIKKRAEGNTLEEVKAVLGGFAEAPLQTLAQGAGSIVPMVAGTLLMPAAAVPAAAARLTSLGVSASTAAKVASSLPASTVGAMMGVGGQKGQDYETVKRELLEKKIPEEEAERLAQKAAEYSLENVPRQLASGAAGALAGGLGVESLVGRIGKKLPEVKGPSLKLPEPTVAQAIGRSTAAEALPEALQSAVSTVGTNVALNQAGVERDLTQGVLANAINDALVGGVLGAGASPLKLKEMRQQYVQDEFKGQQEYQKQQQEEIAANQKKVSDELNMTQNPLGMLTVDDLGADLFKIVQQNRADTGKPALTSFSLDDVVDALPGKDKEAETASLNAIIAAKTGYIDEVYTPAQVIEAAQAKNVETGTQGFDDFLSRTTGISDPAQMSQPQLHAAITSLAKLPGFTSTQSLPEGLNATNYTPQQFTQAIDSLNTKMDELGADELSFKDVTNAIETATGLKGSAVNALINDAARKGDVVTENKKVSVPSRTTPTGYGISEEIGAEQEQATSYEVRRGDEILDEHTTKESADQQVEGLNKLTEEEIKNIDESLKTEEAKINKAEKEVQRLILAGNRSTPEFKVAQDTYQQVTDEAFPRIAELKARKESYQTPLTVAPIGVKKVKPKSYVVRKGQGIQTVKETREEAEQAIFEDLLDTDLQELAKKRSPALQKRVNAEIQRRAAMPAKAAPATAATPEDQAKLDSLKKDLPAMLERFGLRDVGLKIVDAIEGGADGSYQAKLIQIALSAKEPIQTLRHEAIHALKELGFFTPQQWAALERQAKKEWVQKYLKNVMVKVEGQTMSRYDAYANGVKDAKGEYILKPLTEEALLEEAIADAFADFDVNKAPPGMLTALLNKLRNFFAALRNALTGNGFQTYEDVFGKVEKGELKEGQAQAGNKKLSVQLAEEGKPVKEVDPNDVSNIVNNSPYKDAGINVLNSQIEKTSKPLEVDDVGVLFDNAYKTEFGKQGDWRNPTDFKRAVIQAVDELQVQLQQSKSGLDWYDEDIAKAFELTQRSIPSLKKPEKRALFSVIAGIMSPSTNARDNWVIAAQAYQHYEKTGVLPGTNPATGGLWMGGLESANKKKQLDMLNAMLQPKSQGGLGERGAVEWLQGSHTVAEITNFRSKYGGMGKSNVGGKATDILPGFTAFGPKVGPFVMNINGLHEVTVDVWMTRTFNRYFGQMMGSDGKMVRAPTEPQRIAIKNLAVLASQQLGIKPYQVQSVLWFMEQQIFNKLGTGAKSYGFSDGAVKFSETQGGVGGAKVLPANSGANAVANKSTGQQDGRIGVQADQSTTRTTAQGVDDATGRKLPVGQPAARSGAGGRKKLSLQAAEERQPESTGDRRGRDQGRSITPLAGAPIISGATGPDPKIIQVAEDYAKQYGIPYRRQAVYAEIDEDFSKLVADAYEAMPHAPKDPKVKEAYQDLIRQTKNQYDALIDAGYLFTFFDGNTDPYAGNPFNAMRDLRQNKQMAVYGTYDGYGTEGITGAAVEDNPMLEDTGLRWPDQEGVEHMVTANDLFRAVHDAFGHGLEGAGFRAQGEENAWQAHARLFTGPAVGAITSETRGQNSWLNYGPYGEKNRTAKLEDTVFAEQKTGLMPPWTWQDRIVDDEGLVLGVQQPDAISVKGLHYGKARVEELDASKYGTGLRGAERSRLERSDDERIKKRVYFYIQKPDGSTPYPESGVGQYVYTQQFDNVLGSGPTMSRLFNEANGDSNNFESLVVDAGYDGYAVPSMGMMVILNHNTPVKYKGTRSELTGDQKKLSLSKAPPNSLLTKRMSNIGIKSTDDFWKRIQNVMIGTGSRNPSLGAALDTTSTSNQVKQAISVWKQDVEESGIQNYLQRFRIQGAVPEIDDIIAGPPTVKKMLLEAGIRPTLGNAISAYDSLPKSIVNDAVNDMRYSLRKAPETPEFKRFFGNSVVVNADGTPKVMYHGTSQDISTFKPKQAGAIFVTDDPEIAEGFSKDSQMWMAAHADQFLTPEQLDKGVKQAIKIIRSEYGNDSLGKEMIASLASGKYADATAEAQEYLRSVYKSMLPSNPNIMPVYVSAQNPFDYENPAHVQQVVDELNKSFDSYGRKIGDKEKGDIARGNWERIEKAHVQKAIKDLNFDGFYVSEGGKKNLAVYDPVQIKSATGNIGTFDRANPDIRYSLRKAPNTPEFKRFFGDSKVVDADGNPLVVYHGTLEHDDATENEGGAFGQFTGILNWFGVEPYTASGYAKGEGTVYPVYLSIKKPLVITQDANDYVKSTKFISDVGLKVEDFARDLNDLRSDQVWNVVNSPKFAEAAQAAGYDGIEIDEGGYKTFAAFNSTQIKSATGNIGTYDTTNPDIRYSLSKVKNEVDSLPNGAAINASINRLAPGREQKGYIERILDAFKPQSVDALRQQFLNRYNQLGVYDKEVAKQMGGAALLADSSAESAALMSDNAAAIASMACGIEGKGGIPVFDKGYTTISNKNGEKGVLEILMPLAKIGDPRIYQTYQFWAGSLRGSRLLASGKDHTYTKAEIDYAKELLIKYPEFKQVQEDWIKYNNGLMKYAVETGVLSPEKAAEFMKYSDYIPFYRQIDGEKTVGPRLFQNISGVTAPKQLKGLKEGQDIPFADFLETIVRNTQSIIQSGMKNTAAQRAIGQAMYLNVAQKRQDVSYAPGVVTVLEKGKPVSYDVADQLFIDAVKSLNMPELPFLSFFAAPANLLRNLVTKDPGFMMANLMRDSLSAWVTSGAKMTPIASTISNFGKAIGGKDPAYLALRNAGVIGGYEFASGVENSGVILGESLRRATGTQTGTEKALKPFTSLWRGLEKGTEASDAATRMAVYKATLEKTGNEAEAIYRAMEVMNFNRKGNLAIVRILTAAVPFLNARMQGLDVFYRAAFGKMATADAAAIQKSFFIRGATLMALTSMYWFLTHDEEEYLAQEQETRDNNWLFPSAGIRIPIPFEVGVLFKVVPERILEYSFGSDTGKDMADSFKRNLISTFAFNPIPQTVLPFVEARTNYSFFTMRPIVGQGMENVAKEYQVAPNTSEAAKKLGKALGESPIVVDHIMKGYTGSLGMYAIDLIDAVLFSNDASPKPAKRFEQLPVWKRFALDKQAKGTVTAYYELKNSVDEVVRTVNIMEARNNAEDMGDYIEKNAYLLGMKGYISVVEKQMKVLREAAIQIRSSDMSPEEKRESLSAITEAQNAMTANIREIKKSIQP